MLVDLDEAIALVDSGLLDNFANDTREQKVQRALRFLKRQKYYETLKEEFPDQDFTVVISFS